MKAHLLVEEWRWLDHVLIVLSALSRQIQINFRVNLYPHHTEQWCARNSRGTRYFTALYVRLTFTLQILFLTSPTILWIIWEKKITIFIHTCLYYPSVQWLGFQVVQTVKRLPTMWETRVRSLDRKDLLKKAMAPHSSTLAWKIPWTEEPGRLQSIGSQRVGHD